MHNLDAIPAGNGIELSVENQLQYHCICMGNKLSAGIMLAWIEDLPVLGAIVLASNSGVKPHVGEGFVLYVPCNLC